MVSHSNNEKVIVTITAVDCWSMEAEWLENGEEKRLVIPNNVCYLIAEAYDALRAKEDAVKAK